MIKNSQKQTRNILVVAVTISVIIIGVVGFIFWHNYADQKGHTPMASGAADTVSVDPYKDWNTYDAPNSKYEIKYPKNWMALKETVGADPYIRNFDPASKQSHGKYPDGYINMRILRDENNADFKTRTGYTTTGWYDALGKVQVKDGPVAYSSEDVKGLIVNGLPAKSTKAVFTETDEIIYVLRGDVLYSINLYPYGISSDPAVKLMLDSFVFTY